VHLPQPSSHSYLGAFPQPQPFAWSGKGRVDEAIRCRQLQPIAIRRTSETGAFFAPRMRTPRGLSGTLWSLHQTVSTSDVPVVTRRHTRVGIRCPPDVLSSITLLADGDGELTCESKDLSVALPVRVRRASARERLSSYREPASRNPQAMNAKTCLKSHSRALFRLLPIRAPRQAVLRTSSWLAP
jgi:hypothetical protein